MRDTLRYQEIGSSRKYQQPEPKSTTFITLIPQHFDLTLFISS